MGIVTKIIKYGLVFALGYYVGSCSAEQVKYSKLEEVVKYEQNFVKGQEAIFCQRP